MDALLAVVVLLLGGCAVGPNYRTPVVETPPAYKEAGNWKPAQPNDQNLGGDWWKIFQDPQLDALELQVNVSNQNLKAAEAQPIVHPLIRSLMGSPTTTLCCPSISPTKLTCGDEFAAQWSLIENRRKLAPQTWRRSI